MPLALVKLDDNQATREWRVCARSTDALPSHTRRLLACLANQQDAA